MPGVIVAVQVPAVISQSSSSTVIYPRAQVSTRCWNAPFHRSRIPGVRLLRSLQKVSLTGSSVEGRDAVASCDRNRTSAGLRHDAKSLGPGAYYFDQAADGGGDANVPKAYDPALAIIYTSPLFLRHLNLLCSDGGRLLPAPSALAQRFRLTVCRLRGCDEAAGHRYRCLQSGGMDRRGSPS